MLFFIAYYINVVLVMVNVCMSILIDFLYRLWSGKANEPKSSTIENKLWFFYNIYFIIIIYKILIHFSMPNYSHRVSCYQNQSSSAYPKYSPLKEHNSIQVFL